MTKASSYLNFLIALTLMISVLALASSIFYSLHKHQLRLHQEQNISTQVNSVLNRITFEIKSSKQILTTNFPTTTLTYLNSQNETKTLQLKNKRLARIGLGTSYLTNKAIKFNSLEITKIQSKTYQLKLTIQKENNEQEFKRSIHLIND